MSTDLRVQPRREEVDPTTSLRPRIAILYHYMHPDDVVSALHLDHLAQGLASNGWEVEAIPSNRGCRDEKRTYGSSEYYLGVLYRRVWRPGFSQKLIWGRLANSLWMIAAWSGLAFRRESRRPDVILIGTDPVFAAATAILLRWLAPDIRLVHWCFDMHPEAAIAEGLISQKSLVARLLHTLMARAYRSFDLIADLGVCMRRRLKAYNHSAIERELTPWALAEPERPVECDSQTRLELFNDASMGILYSGNFGEAHEFSNILTLARALRHNTKIHFSFALRGNRAEEFRQAVTHEDINISFAEFAPIEELEKRLGSADIHLVSLKKEWAGISVPSKFFGSIATGRPVLYCGANNSAISQWIAQHQIGWMIDPENIQETASSIAQLADNMAELSELKAHCHAVYNSHFSRQRIVARWNTELRLLL